MPEPPPIYADNPLGLPMFLPAGWSRRPWREWSRVGKCSLIVIVGTMALPVLLYALSEIIRMIAG